METEREIPEFSKEYFSARKQYGLFSALLLAWELIGIDVPAAPMENLKITLKSPQAVPYVLIALVVYFAYRFIVEWYQSSVRRRELRVSRVDFWVSHMIALTALGVFVIQIITKAQIVSDKYQSLLLFRIVVTTIFGMISYDYIVMRISIQRKIRVSSMWGVIVTAILAASASILSLSDPLYGWIETALVTLSGLYCFIKLRRSSMEEINKEASKPNEVTAG